MSHKKLVLPAFHVHVLFFVRCVLLIFLVFCACVFCSLFSICSGQKANFDKTQVVWIGARQGCGLELKTNTDIEWNHSGSFKLLGIKYSLAKDDRYMYIDNYYSKLEKIKKLLNDWSLRNISLLGKITVIKTLALPILVIQKLLNLF
jgi:hypothetical protein